MNHILLVEVLNGVTSSPSDAETLAQLMNVASTTQFVRLHEAVIARYGSDLGETLWEAARARYTEEVKGQ